MKVRAALAGIAAAILLAPGTGHAASVLDDARELFAKNRWPEARAAVHARWRSLGPHDRALAQYVIGRAYGREAELLHHVRAFADEVAREYFRELDRDEASRDLTWIGLFRGLHALARGDDREAERALAEAAAREDLPDTWRQIARLRREVALVRLGGPAGARGLASQPGHEAGYWRLVLLDDTSGAPGTPKDGERLFAASVLLRQGRPKEADALLAGVDPDRPAAEHHPAPHKLLRFFDPQLLEAHERALRQQSVRWLRPLAAGSSGPQAALSSYHAGANLYHLGRSEEARALLESAAKGSISARDRGPAHILLTAAALEGSEPPTGELAGLWKSTSTDAKSVLVWADVKPNGHEKLEPFATLLPARLRALGADLDSEPDRAAAGRWGLARLRAGADPSQMVRLLSRVRDNSNKNKVEANDPLLLLAIAQASYRNAEYAQSLETLSALSEVYPGLRGVHWNLQGTYAARQQAGGEARISQ